MDLEKLPLVVLEGLVKLKKSLREIIKENNELIKEVQSSGDNFIVIRSIDLTSFTFTIEGGFLNERTRAKSVFFTGKVKPESDQSNSEINIHSNYEGTMGIFLNWLTILKRFDNLDFEEEDIKQYEQEHFVNYFQIIDEGADTNAFNLEQQVLLLNVLDEFERLNQEEENEYNEIILEEITEAKSMVTRSPQNTFMRKFSKILAYARKAKMSFFKKFLDVFVKEMMKKALWKGLENLNKLIEIFPDLLGKGETLM